MNGLVVFALRALQHKHQSGSGVTSIKGSSVRAGSNNRLNYLPGAQFGVGLLEFIPDRLEDGGKGSDSNACADEHADLIVKHVLAGRAKRPVHAHSGGDEKPNKQ